MTLEMQTRALGGTGLTVSRMGLGMAALGRPGYINLGHAGDLHGEYRPECMERSAHAVLDAAYATGVRYFDAARSYGRAEAFLASWLTSRRRAARDCIIGSKWGYAYTAAWQVDAAVHEVKEHSLERFLRQLDETRALLGDRVALYQVHSLTGDSRMFDDPKLLRALARLRDAGVGVGATVTGPAQARAIERVLACTAGGVPLFATVQATWNLFERSAEDALTHAANLGVGVIVKEALANGRLTERNRDPAFARRLHVLRSHAARLDATVDALALAAVAARPWADVVLSGAATVEQMRSNVGAMSVTLDAEALAALDELVEPPGDYWSQRARLAWN